MSSITGRLFAALTVLAILATACAGNAQSGASGSPDLLAGDVKIDGSSTVFPISEAMAEEFQKANRNVRVTVGISGTGGGFTKFCNKETDISDASRAVKATEKEICDKNGVEFVETQVAIDGLSVVVHSQTDFVDCLTFAELKKIFDQGSTINNWKDVRAGFPDLAMKLYGPGHDSGTFDYFTEAINGKEKQHRSDYTASEDDNTLVQGVTSARGSIGYFGYAYYEENKSRLKLLKVDKGAGAGCIEPTPATIESYGYPIARPIFIYPNKASLKRPEVMAYVEFYMDKANRQLISEVGYIPAPDKVYTDGLAANRAAAR